MDPISAIGLAASLITFVDFTAKLVRGSSQLYSSSGDATAENAHVGNILADLQHVTDAIKVTEEPDDRDSKELAKLAGNCRSLSDELATILDGLRVRNKNSKRETVRATWMSMRRQKSIASIEKRLGEYRAEIMFRMNVMICSRNSLLAKQVDLLRKECQSLGKSSIDRISEAQKTLETLAGSFSNQKSPADFEEFRRALSAFTEMSRSERQQNDVLKFFSYPSMNLREDQVEDAEEGTFDWILPGDTDDEYNDEYDDEFDDEYDDEQDDEHDDAQDESSLEKLSQPREQEATTPSDNTSESSSGSSDDDDGTDASGTHFDLPPADTFQRWARDEMSDEERAFRSQTSENLQDFIQRPNGLFFICGKAGSGKTTLMKHIANHKSLDKGLQSWAGDRKLVVTRFFFWNSGDKLQMSLSGFYRSILFEVLKACPHLASQILPARWTPGGVSFGDYCTNSSNQNRVMPEPSQKDLEDLTAKLIGCDLLDCCLCLIIDGLDEYEGDSLQHLELAKFLKRWSAKDGVKILCSARPHSEFLDVLSSPDDTIRLENLTRGDIFHYCLARFNRHLSDEQKKNSIQSFYQAASQVADMADGVFLWARLVVRSVLSGIFHSDSAKALQERLKGTPRQLSLLFEKIIESIDPAVRHRSEQILFLATRNPLQYPLNALCYSWLEDLDDVEFPYNQPCRGIDNQEVVGRLANVRHQLDSLTRGLLEMTHTTNQLLGIPASWPLYWRFSVSFLHRTVKDFFKEKWNNLPELQLLPKDAYTRLLLAHLKFGASSSCLLPSHMGFSNTVIVTITRILTTAAQNSGELGYQVRRSVERPILQQICKALRAFQAIDNKIPVPRAQSRILGGKNGPDYSMNTGPEDDSLNIAGWLTFYGKGWFILENLRTWITDGDETLHLKRQTLRICTQLDSGLPQFSGNSLYDDQCQKDTIKRLLESSFSIDYETVACVKNEEAVAELPVRNHLLLVHNHLNEILSVRVDPSWTHLDVYIKAGRLQNFRLLLFIEQSAEPAIRGMRPCRGMRSCKDALFQSDFSSVLRNIPHGSEGDLWRYLLPNKRSILGQLGDAVSGKLFAPAEPSLAFSEYRPATSEELLDEKLRCWGVSDGTHELVGRVERFHFF